MPAMPPPYLRATPCRSTRCCRGWSRRCASGIARSCGPIPAPARPPGCRRRSCRRFAGQIVMLEPRRVAARAAARRIAFENGWELGREVGYQVRFERRAGKETRILVVTEGILVQMLQQDPFLDGIGCVILDEQHERHLTTDLVAGDGPQGAARGAAGLAPAGDVGHPRPGPPARLPRRRHRPDRRARPAFPVEVEYLERPDARGLPTLVRRRGRPDARAPPRATCWFSCPASARSAAAASSWSRWRRVHDLQRAAALRRPAARAAGRRAPARERSARWCWRPTWPKARSPSTG